MRQLIDQHFADRFILGHEQLLQRRDGFGLEPFVKPFAVGQQGGVEFLGIGPLVAGRLRETAVR